MQFHGMEAIVIDLLRTEELQRLRRIRQMGLGYLVFPGAEHSRLVHCLGAAHLAIQFGRHLQEAARDALVELMRPSEDSIRDLAIAALCRDCSTAISTSIEQTFSSGTPFSAESHTGATTWLGSYRPALLVRQLLIGGWSDGIVAKHSASSSNC